MPKQSKYSKRRPKDKPAFYIKEVQTTGIKSGATLPALKRSIPSPEYLPKYNVGIFIDDQRKRDQVRCPEADVWFEFTGYRDFSLWLGQVHDGNIDIFPAESVFISFDHYLDEDPRRPTGVDCMYYAMEVKDALGTRVDIQGHSSDSVMNDKKMIAWYKGD